MKPLINAFMQRTREPIAYAISYVEPDGTRETDVYLSEPMAQWWERLCREDGCEDVEMRPLY